MTVKRSTILALALVGTSLFAKGPLLDGVYSGANPLDASRPLTITFKLENSGTKVVNCNFNFQCDYESEAARLTAIVDSDIFAPNGDHGWKVAFQNPEGRPVFEVLFNDPMGQDGIILRQLGLGLTVPLRKVGP